MTQTKPSLGQAIDQAIAALEPLAPPDREIALNAVCSHLQITLGAASPAHGLGVPAPMITAAPPTEVRTGTSKPTIDIRTLKTSKNPKSAKDMACLVAFYLQEYAPEGERKSTIGAKDLEKYFKQAGFKLPTKIEQVLVDAKRSGYFESTAVRGEYKLNAVGYNRVAHTMPEKGSSSE